MTTASTSPAPQAIILAAGKGTRMGGDLPKVVHEVAGKPMVHWVVQACKQAGVSRCVVVVGYKGDLVRQALAGETGVEFVEQTEQLGTGHAARMAEPLFTNAGNVDVFVLAGDGPLIRPQTLTALLQLHRERKAGATLATAILDDPTGYGRVMRDARGGFEAIIEQKDANSDQLAIREVNPSYYCFVAGDLFASLARVRNDNKQNEYYLTDVPAMLKRQGKPVCVIDAVPAEDVLSINTPDQLAQVDAILRQRLGMPPAARQSKESV
jgi:bifunctional UDP-N-acetylglucosamine pyrophosphorylase/glucosamine-1-phosphate N-acetyltransferase